MLPISRRRRLLLLLSLQLAMCLCRAAILLGALLLRLASGFIIGLF